MIRFSGDSRKKQDIFKKTHTIGMIASAPEIDIAAASIALANYYRSAKGYNTALAIAGDDDGFRDMLSGAECIDIDPCGYNNGILACYFLKNRNDLERMMDKGYDRIVIDLAAGRYANEDLLQIERINAFISTTVWRIGSTRQFLHSTIIREERLRQRFGNTVYSVTGTAGMCRSISEEFRIGVQQTGELASISDPYRLTRDDLRIISRLA